MDGIDRIVVVGVNCNCESLSFLDHECGRHVGMPTAVSKQVKFVCADGFDNVCNLSQFHARAIWQVKIDTVQLVQNMQATQSKPASSTVQETAS